MNLPNISANPMQPMTQGALGGMGSIETGEFDFLEYFLGLQAGPDSTNNPLEFGLPNSEMSGEPLNGQSLMSGLTDPLSQGAEQGPVAKAVSQVLQGGKSPEMQLLGGLVPDQSANPVSEAQASVVQPEVVLESVQADLPAPSAAELDIAAQLTAARLQKATPGEKTAVESPMGESSALEPNPEPLGQTSVVEAMESESNTRVPAAFGQEQEMGQDASMGERFSLSDSPEPVAREAQPMRTESSSTLNPVLGHSTVSQPVELTGKAPMQMPDVHVPESNLREVASGVQNLRDAGGGTMKISLNPPELGEVEIKVTNHGRDVGIEIRSENQVTKSLLEANLGNLRTAIHAQDLSVSKLEVQQGTLGQDSHQSNDSMPNFEQATDERERGQNWQNLSRYQQASSVEGPIQGKALGSTRSESRVDLRV